MEPLGSTYIEHWDCDWKIAMDNYLESYHVPIGHPGLNRMFTPDYDDQRNFDGVARGISWLRERPSSRWSERMYQQMIEKVATDSARTAPQALELLQPAAEPRHRRVSGPDGFLPGAAARAGQVHDPRRRPSGCRIERREMRIARYLSARINRQVQREDEFLCRRVQQGLASQQLRARPAVDGSRTACSSSTTCCASAFPRYAWRARRRASPSR